MSESSKKNQLARILRQLADYIEHRSDDELIPLFEEASRLLPITPPSKKNRGSRERKLAGHNDLQQIADQLRGLPSRDEGETFLREKIQSKTSLEAMARFLQLPVQRDDTVERLRAKIVESQIGHRLRSDAIQGRPPEG